MKVQYYYGLNFVFKKNHIYQIPLVNLDLKKLFFQLNEIGFSLLETHINIINLVKALLNHL